MDAIRVLVAEDNQPLCEQMRRYFETQNDIEIVGFASQGLEALDMVRALKPDVLLLDIIMPEMDGFYVLEKLLEPDIEKRPEVIVITGLGRDDFVQRAMSLGAQYYIVKPYKFELLTTRIHDMMGLRMRNTPVSPSIQPASVPSLDEKIANMFLTIGVPAHIKGYHFLREAVKMVLDDPTMINAITKALYPGIAKRYATSASKVERAIRHAIEVAWSRGRVENFNQAFGYIVFSPGDKPTNGEFIALIADKLSMERTA